MVFKRAMKAEAIKRGEKIDSDWECEEDDDKVEMTATHCESKWIEKKEEDFAAEVKKQAGASA